MKIPKKTLESARFITRQRLHYAVLRAWVENSMTIDIAAEMLGRKRAWVAGIINEPGEWTIDTVSDLLFVVGAEIEISVVCKSESGVTTFGPTGERS